MVYGAEVCHGETITILTNSAGEKCSLKSWVAADEKHSCGRV